MRRLATLTLVLVVAAGLTACGGGDSTTTTTTTTSTSVAATSTTAATTSSTSGSAALELATTGLGPLHLGATVAEANATGLIGSTNPGCELGGPGVLSAPLTGVVHGTVTFANGSLTAIVVAGGANTTEGIHVGSTLDELHAAYPAPTFAVTEDSSTVDTFGIINVTVMKGGNPAFGMTVDPSSHMVQDLWIPAVQFCD
jgi:hypothetical protein